MTKFIFLVGHAGNGNKPWDFRTLEAGMGGSESCLVHLTNALADAGNEVSVFGWTDYHGFNDHRVYWSDSDNKNHYSYDDVVYVSWRQPHLLVGLHGKQNWVYDHNGINHPDPTPDQWKWVDRFICLNQWHLDRYASRGAPKEKLVIGGTAIDMTPFTLKNVERIQHRCVAHFHPHRGMAELREHWVKVREAVPNATLQPLWWQNEMFAEFPPIPELGILPYCHAGPSEVAYQILRSQVFTYPATGTETAPLTVIEAQAGGAFPVVIPVGGMNEVMRFGRVTNQRYFYDALIDVLKHPPTELLRLQMMQDTQARYSWSAVAKRFVELAEG